MKYSTLRNKLSLTTLVLGTLVAGSMGFSPASAQSECDVEGLMTCIENNRSCLADCGKKAQAGMALEPCWAPCQSTYKQCEKDRKCVSSQ